MENLEMLDDITLYKQFLKDNKNAFDVLVDRYSKKITNFIYGYVKNYEVAEDLAQDVFVYILINKNVYNFKYSFKSYLYIIARFRALNYIKREKKKISYEENINYIKNIESLYSVEDDFLNRELKEKIIKTLKELKPNQQRVYYLADIEKLSYKEISNIIGKSLTETKMIIYRTRKSIKKLLKKEGASDE